MRQDRRDVSEYGYLFLFREETSVVFFCPPEISLDHIYII